MIVYLARVQKSLHVLFMDFLTGSLSQCMHCILKASLVPRPSYFLLFVGPGARKYRN